MTSWNTGWQRTDLPGIYSLDGCWRIRARVSDARTGRLLERNRIFSGIGLAEAEAIRQSMRTELERQVPPVSVHSIQDFGRRWLEIKQPLIDAGTHARHQSALEDHAFRRLGRIHLRELRLMDVQGWINFEICRGYRLDTVKGWYRVLRTMIQDAMDDLGLEHDPSRRVRFPLAAVDEREETNALLPEQLDRFLTVMKASFPRHYPLAATLALTGLRFCHATALRWEDFDEDTRILHIRRRQLRGRVGPVTLVKRAPKEYPVSPKLMEILREHRQAGRRRGRWERGLDVPLAHGRAAVPVLAPEGMAEVPGCHRCEGALHGSRPSPHLRGSRATGPRRQRRHPLSYRARHREDAALLFERRPR